MAQVTSYPRPLKSKVAGGWVAQIFVLFCRIVYRRQRRDPWAVTSCALPMSPRR
jgi:hypothetical protein